MTNDVDEIINICKNACKEFHDLGFKKDIDPRTLKESYNILKQADGSWHKSTKLGLHEQLIKSLIDFDKMPYLKKLTLLIDERDEEINKKGGRIFITENLIYKLKKGTEYPIFTMTSSSLKTDSAPARHQALCEEISEHGYGPDRFRVEETYLVTKSSSGEWSMSSTHENLSAKKTILNLAKMPNLKALANKLNKIDSAFQINGGRIFITPTRIYRIKNKIEIDFKI